MKDSVINIDVVNENVVLTLAQTVKNGAVVYASYVPSAYDATADINGNRANSFINLPLTNRTPLWYRLKDKGYRMVYMPVRGFAQSNYYDQQATALPGMCANASDFNLIDTAFVFPGVGPYGLQAGVGCVIIQATDPIRPGINEKMIAPVDSRTTDATFGGIVVRNQLMSSNVYGEAVWFAGDTANFARRDRQGARIWVYLSGDTPTELGGDVYMIIQASGQNRHLIGSFSAAPIAGTAVPTAGFMRTGAIVPSSLLLTKNGGFTLPINGANVNVTGLDFSGANTVEAIANVIAPKLTNATVQTVGPTIQITSKVTGTSSSIGYATAPTTANVTDVSTLLAMTPQTNAVTSPGTAGVATDTIKISKARWNGRFSYNANKAINIGEIELL